MINLRETFKDRVSSSAFKTIDGELRIVGKYGQVSTIGDKFDVWFVADPPLTKLRVTLRLQKLPENGMFHVLNGEAYTQTRDVRLVDLCLPLLGVRKKRRYSDEYRQVLAERVRNI